MVEFGNFNEICKTVTLAICPLLGPTSFSMEPYCYSRNFEIAGTLIFQPSTILINLVAIVMTAIMIFNIKSKYTAVGRKEMVMVFYFYLLLLIFDIILISGFIVPVSNTAYPYFTAIYVGLLSAFCWCLLLNGFIGFQFTEDGTRFTVWSIRLSSLLIFAIAFFIALATFNEIGPFSPTSQMPLFIIYIVFNLICLILYVILQVVLVVKTLDEYWPLGALSLAVIFFIIGQVINFFFSSTLCELFSHYVDGLFIGTVCTLLSMMMVYKFWDSLTKEDLEFSVGGAGANFWEVKELLADDELGNPKGQLAHNQY